LASVFHHRFENVDFGLGGEHLTLAMVLGALSAVGGVASVFVAVNLSSSCLSLCIGLMATVWGSVMLATLQRDLGFQGGGWWLLGCRRPLWLGGWEAGC